MQQTRTQYYNRLAKTKLDNPYASLVYPRAYGGSPVFGTAEAEAEEEEEERRDIYPGKYLSTPIDK